MEGVVWGKGSGPAAVFFGTWKQPGFLAILQAIALAANVDRGRVMKQPVQDGCGNDRISEDRAPIAVAFVRSENDAASFVTGTDKLKENGCTQIIEWQVPHFVDDENFGRQIDAHAPIESAFTVSTSKIVDQIMRRHKVRAKAGLDGGFCKRHTQMRLADSRRT